MKIAIPKERRAHEHRVAATPDSVKRYRALGFEVLVEAGAGAACRIGDEQYRDAGATLIADPYALFAQADILLKVQRPLLRGEHDIDELSHLKPGCLLLGVLAPHSVAYSLDAYARAGITAIALELVPRITRAQGMDVLSSQSNLAGYRAVLDAVYHFDRVLPMMMTAAGTIAPARVMVFGAGVAGLQAIATAKRLGAIVSATDVRLAAKEQVESLGGKFVMVDSEEMRTSETAGGYAKEMSEDFKRRQAELVAATLAKQDIAICTALIPGRKAPVLITEAMVHSMKPGSVIVDLATEQGGNCALSQPGEVIEVNGVTIVGHLNMPGRIASDASALYARNLFNFLAPHVRKQDGGATLELDHADEIVKAALVCHGGHIVHPAFAPKPD